MKPNKNRFLNDIDVVISCYDNKNEDGCKKALQQLLSNTPYLGQIVYCFLHDSNTTSIQFCTIARALSIVHKYSMDNETKVAVTELIVGCYARAFSICPLKERHKIAYDLNCFLDNTFYTRYIKKHSLTICCTYLDDFFLNYYLESDEECEPIYRNEQKLIRLIQWYILCHVLQLYKINPLIIPIDSIVIRSKIKEYYKQFCNIEETKLKKYIIRLLTEIIEDCTTEDFLCKTIELLFLYNDFDKIECHDEELEARIEAEMEYDEYLQNQSDSSYQDNTEEYDGFGRYKGSYAQDEMGYSDDDIDTIFDGDPSAYWNID